MAKRKDENELAKSLIDDLIDWTESDDFEITERQKIASEGGKARAANLTAEERTAIAKKAAKSRWNADDED